MNWIFGYDSRWIYSGVKITLSPLEPRSVTVPIPGLAVLIGEFSVRYEQLAVCMVPAWV